MVTIGATVILPTVFQLFGQEAYSENLKAAPRYQILGEPNAFLLSMWATRDEPLLTEISAVPLWSAGISEQLVC